MASTQKQSTTDKLNLLLKKAADLPNPKIVPRYEIDSVVSGSYLATQLGDVFVCLGLSHFHS